MSDRVGRYIAALLLLVVLWQCARWTRGAARPPAVTVASVQALVRQRLPAGSRVNEVNAFMAAPPVAAEYPIRAEPYDAKTGMAKLWIGGVSRSLLQNTDIEVTFFFNEKGRLTRTRVQEVYTGV